MNEIATRAEPTAVDLAQAVVDSRPTPGTLALAGDQTEWTPVQQAALEHIGIADAPGADQQVFMHVCQRTGLDPFARQIYMIARTEGRGQSAKKKWTIQTGIDGFRAKAGERPEYRGQIGPQWCGDDGVWRDVWVSPKPPAAARVGIIRDDFREPIWGIAMYREYVQTTTWDNVTQPTKMWREKAAHMTAKCAEALGLRRAFPDQLGGIYTDDEMGHLDNPREGRRVRTVIDQAPVTAAELTGARPAAPSDASESPATSTDRMTPEQQADLLKLVRASDVADTWGWASGVLGRSVKSYGQLSGADARQLVGALRGGNEPGPTPIDRRRSNHLHALLGEAGLGDKNDTTRSKRLRLCQILIDRDDLTTTNDLTAEEADVVIDTLRGYGDQAAQRVADLLEEDAQRTAWGEGEQGEDAQGDS